MRKKFGLLFALLLVFATAIPAAAAPGLGSSPYVALPLGSGSNSGKLAPAQVLWYSFSLKELSIPDSGVVTMNMQYQPGNREMSSYVNFQVLTFDQVDQFLQGNTDEFQGVGTLSADTFDANTAERLWSGQLDGRETYYVRLFNNSHKEVNFKLSAVSHAEGSPVQKATVAKPAAMPAAAKVGGASLLSTSSPALTRWLLVAMAIQSMAPDQAAEWLLQASQLGWLGSQARTESASLPAAAVPVQQKTKTVAAEAASVAAASTSQNEAQAPAVHQLSQAELYPSIYPNTALALRDGPNVGRLAANGEHWFRFIHDARDGKWYEQMKLTLFTTPVDGNESHYVNFQIFTGNQYTIWQRGTPDDMKPMGAGGWVSRDKDPRTGERVWDGYVVQGDIYYVRIFNQTDHTIDYYLLTGDVTNTELGNRVWAANPITSHTLWQPSNYVPSEP